MKNRLLKFSLVMALLTLSVTAQAKIEAKIAPKGMKVLNKYDMSKGWFTIGGLNVYRPTQIKEGVRHLTHFNFGLLNMRMDIRIDSITSSEMDEAKQYRFETDREGKYHYFISNYDNEKQITTGVDKIIAGGKVQTKELKGDISNGTIDPLTAVFYYLPKQRLREGENIKIKVSDANLPQEAEFTYKVEGSEKIENNGKEIDTFIVTTGHKDIAFIVEEKGFTVKAWISKGENPKLVKLELTTPKTGLISFSLKS